MFHQYKEHEARREEGGDGFARHHGIRTTLNAARLASGSFRILLVAVRLGLRAVGSGIVVEQDSDHAQLLGALDLEAAEDAPVLGDTNLALEGDVRLDEILKVLVGTAVDEDDRGSDVAGGAVAVESRDAVLCAGGRVVLEHVLLEGGLEGHVPRRRTTLGLLLFQEGDSVVDGTVDVAVIRDDGGGINAEVLPLLLCPQSLHESYEFSSAGQSNTRRGKTIRLAPTHLGEVLAGQVSAMGVVVAPLLGLLARGSV